jgi:hypothetical protein
VIHPALSPTGTDVRVLYEQVVGAHDAARALLAALREMAPRMADYPDPHALAIARAYHEARLGSVERVRAELDELAAHIAGVRGR